VIIGLTGLYCAGKNQIALLLEKRGFAVLDVDKFGHEVIRSEAPAIRQCFGDTIMAGNEIDRKLLGKLVFGNSEALSKLEAIIHPAVNTLTEKWISSQESPCVINAALLHKASVFSRLDALIVITAPFAVRMYRAWKRDKLPPAAFIKRHFSQSAFPRYRGKTKLFSHPADIHRVKNSGISGSLRNAEKRIDAILEGLCHGKEKDFTSSGFSGGISGNRG
jgi:dephospho-CoA kinase